MNTVDPQTRRVLDLMIRDGHITRLSAQHYGIANVTARIADLRLRHGHPVRCEVRKDADGRRYGAWKLIPKTESVAPPQG
jgi:hypothetical protein